MGAPGYPEFIPHMVPENVSASEVADAKATTNASFPASAIAAAT